jgi:hypothetical protein
MMVFHALSKQQGLVLLLPPRGAQLLEDDKHPFAKSLGFRHTRLKNKPVYTKFTKDGYFSSLGRTI